VELLAVVQVVVLVVMPYFIAQELALTQHTVLVLVHKAAAAHLLLSKHLMPAVIVPK
jgi:hypothetical protein